MAAKNWSLDHADLQSRRLEKEVTPVTRFMAQAVADLGGYQPAKMLDFGCGTGNLVRGLRSLGLNALGCDIRPYWQGIDDPCVKHLSIISAESPLQLPFLEETFDSVISTSVLEHAQNKDEIFREIYRILTPGGHMLHLFPGKFYCPVEPHIYVPIVNWLWPYVPRFWLAFWAILGIRNEFQVNLGWKQVTDLNAEYVATGLSYWPHRRIKRSVERVFGNCQFPNKYYIQHAPGGFASICRKLPLKSLTGWTSGHLRIGLLFAKKEFT